MPRSRSSASSAFTMLRNFFETTLETPAFCRPKVVSATAARWHSSSIEMPAATLRASISSINFASVCIMWVTINANLQCVNSKNAVTQAAILLAANPAKMLII